MKKGWEDTDLHATTRLQIFWPKIFWKPENKPIFSAGIGWSRFFGDPGRIEPGLGEDEGKQA